MQPTGEQRPTAGIIQEPEVNRAAQARDDLLAPFRGGQAVPAQVRQHYTTAASELTGYLGVLSAADAGESWVTPDVMRSAAARGAQAIETLIRLADIAHVNADDLQDLHRLTKGSQ